jgi:hypothetical protein
MCIVTHGGADLGWVKKGSGVGSGSGGRVQRYRAHQVLGGERGVESRERERDVVVSGGRKGCLVCLQETSTS